MTGQVNYFPGPVKQQQEKELPDPIVSFPEVPMGSLKIWLRRPILWLRRPNLCIKMIECFQFEM